MRKQGRAEAAAIARPPQIDAGDDEDDAEAGGDLDQEVTGATVRAHEQFAVYVGEEVVPCPGLRAVLKDRAAVGIDRHHAIAVGEIDLNDRGMVRPPGRDELAECPAGVGSSRAIGLRGGSQLLALRRDLEPVSVFGRHTGEPENGEARKGKSQKKGYNEETGIEVPAPDGAIKSRARHSILLRHRNR